MDERVLIDSWIAIFRRQKSLGERAMAQVPDAALHDSIAEGMNSIATVVKHMAGNMRSRWTDWLTTDGEKPDRNREDEFVDSLGSREEIMARWEEGWSCVFSALEALTAEGLDGRVMIRGEAHSIPDAVNRQIDHYGYHVGQIVTYARVLAPRHGCTWAHLSIAPGGTDAFNDAMRERHGSF